MPWLRKALKHSPVRASAHTAATTSAYSAPTSNIASAEASAAASAAIAELTAGLDFVFDRFGDEDDPTSTGCDDQLQYHLDCLGEEAEKYPASSLKGLIGERAEWPDSLSPGTSELLRAVCECAVMVYEQKEEVGCGPKGFEIEPVLHRTPSSMGTVKASSMWKIPFAPIPGWCGKTLVVSIRGTSTIADHMVNMNGKPKDAGELFTAEGEDIKAHAGFLGCAKAVIATITEDILHQLNADGGISNIIFTGHSAGGSVASLVFLHFALHKSLPTQLEKTKLSLITFGSAPAIANSHLTALCKRRPNINLVLSIVNEYDMVARADPPYLRSLVDLYRSRNGLPPISVLDLKESGDSTEKDPDAWQLPLPTYHHVGDIIVLQLRLTDSDVPATHDDDTFSQAPTMMPASGTVKAVELTPQEFPKLLFCDLGSHRRAAYLERMKMLVSQACGGTLSLNGDMDSLSRVGTDRTLVGSGSIKELRQLASVYIKEVV